VGARFVHESTGFVGVSVTSGREVMKPAREVMKLGRARTSFMRRRASFMRERAGLVRADASVACIRVNFMEMHTSSARVLPRSALVETSSRPAGACSARSGMKPVSPRANLGRPDVSSARGRLSRKGPVTSFLRSRAEEARAGMDLTRVRTSPSPWRMSPARELS
jgi:hypothetical protein